MRLPRDLSGDDLAKALAVFSYPGRENARTPYRLAARRLRA